jgi:hypothetical protein
MSAFGSKLPNHLILFIRKTNNANICNDVHDHPSLVYPYGLDSQRPCPAGRSMSLVQVFLILPYFMVVALVIV